MFVIILCGCAWISSPALAQHYHFDGIDKDNDIKKKTVVFNVIQIVLKLFDGVLDRGAVSVTNLCPSCYSGLDAVSHIVKRYFRAELVDKIGSFRTRTNKTHISIQNIEYLRKLIDSQLADDSAYARYAGIVGRCPLGFPAFLRIISHASEFKNHKGFTAFSHPFLTIKNWGTIL